eukprot:gb/GECH01009984.1/.p1 GENE.gb/GECH01009984.1/~~gb/GECH01009984.1/.p1  ORF type:complete len:388 (+),score=76.18 gb/GECH01009984.1/:1-1164(+)
MYQAITLRTRSFVHPPTILSRRINTFHHSSFSSFKKINVHNSSFNQNYLTYNKTNKIYSFKEHSEIPNCVNILKSDPKIDQKIKILFSQKRCYYYRHSVNRYDPGIYGRYSRLSPRTRRRLKLLGLLLLLLSVYILLNIEEAPVTRRKRLMLLSPEHDRDLGAQTIEAFFASVGEHRIYPVNHPVAKTVRRIGMRIVAALEEDEGVAERYPGQQDLPDLPHRHHSTQQHRHHHDYNYDYNDYDGHQSSIEDHSVASKSSLKSMYQWNFYVVDSPEINAFCAPGGDVVVFSGLLNLVDNEDQLASVLSHEISHAISPSLSPSLSPYLSISISRTRCGETLHPTHPEHLPDHLRRPLRLLHPHFADRPRPRHRQPVLASHGEGGGHHRY